MSIKNKNGTEYKIRQPNPIMKNQDVWNDFTLHNMDFEKDTVAEKSVEQYVPNKKLVLGSEKTIKDTPQTVIKPPVNVEIKGNPDDFVIPDFSKPEIEKAPDPTEPPKDSVLRPATINPKLLAYKKDIMHCMLAETKENFDPLYSEKSVKVTYVKNFIFENIIINQNDIELIFWSHLDYLTKNSIIYPRDNNHRWWKINTIRSAPDGRFFQCVPTSVQPSFKS